MLRICLLLLILYPALTFAHENTNILNVLALDGYFPPSVINSFDHKYNAKINLTYYYSEQELDNLLFNKNNKRNYDVIICLEKNINNYIDAGIIIPIIKKYIPNLKHLNTTLINTQRIKPYSIFISYMLLGVIYNKNKFPQGIPSWTYLFNLPITYQEKIFFGQGYGNVFDTASLALTQAINHQSLVKTINSAKLIQKTFLRLKPLNLNKQEVITKIDDESLWLTYEYYNNKHKYKNKNIDFTFPHGETTSLRSYAMVHSQSKKIKLAHQWINHLLKPNNALKLQQFNHFFYPNNTIDNTKKDKIHINSHYRYNTIIENKRQYLYDRIIEQKTAALKAGWEE